MKTSAAFSITVSCVAVALGALSACAQQGSTIFLATDAGIPLTTPDTGFTAGSGSGSGLGSGTGAAMGTGLGTGSGTGSSHPDASMGSGDAGGPTSGTGTGTGTGAGSGSGSGPGNLGDPEPAVMMGMTAAHNAARAAVQPVATPALPTMSWSATIAASAQAFTTNCVFADTMDQYGSNAFAGTGTYKPADVVAAWVGEDAYYDYASNSCASGQQCGHYTQVVWRDSVKVGCGMTTCTANNPFGGHGSWELWVCNYDPPGNYVGQKPY